MAAKARVLCLARLSTWCGAARAHEALGLRERWFDQFPSESAVMVGCYLGRRQTRSGLYACYCKGL
jgi:hypothetical protein